MQEEKVIRQSVAFEPEDYQVIQKFIKDRGLGRRGFSTAIRMIIREWLFLRSQQEQSESNEKPTT